MDKTRFFGFWKEHCGERFPSLLEETPGILPEHEAIAIADYLEQCPVWVASPGMVHSPLPDGGIAGSMSVRTDGEWAWQDTMAYYVRKYCIGLPAEFLRHAKERGYVPPILDVSSLEFPDNL